MGAFATLSRWRWRGFVGWIPDPRDPRDKSIDVLGLATDIAPEHSLDRGFAPKDQSRSNSCTGQGAATALRLAYLAQGIDCPDLSALFPYYTGRREHQTRVTDDGTFIRATVKSIARFGICAEHRWPFALSRVNRQPGWSAFRAAHDYRGLRGYYRIPKGDTMAVRRAIHADRPVIAGWEVNRAFTLRTGPEVIDTLIGPFIGGHCMTIAAYHRDDTFTLLNSWGAWRQNGRQRVTEGFIAKGIDLWALDIRP